MIWNGSYVLYVKESRIPQRCILQYSDGSISICFICCVLVSRPLCLRRYIPVCYSTLKAVDFVDCGTGFVSLHFVVAHTLSSNISHACPYRFASYISLLCNVRIVATVFGFVACLILVNDILYVPCHFVKLGHTIVRFRCCCHCHCHCLCWYSFVSIRRYSFVSIRWYGLYRFVNTITVHCEYYFASEDVWLKQNGIEVMDGGGDKKVIVFFYIFILRGERR